MHISYKPLWHTLLERDMRKEDLRLAAGMTTNMIANMSKEGKHISMDTLARMGGKFAEQTVVNPTAFQQCHHLIVQMQLRQWRVDLLPVLCPAQQIFLHEKDTIRQGLERFMVHGYTAVPVLNDQEQYIGSVTEGDFLRHLLVCQTTDLKVQEGYRLGSIVRRNFCPALQIDADFEQVVTSMLNQNFVPIVDGRNALCGILTRKRLIEFLAQARDKKEYVLHL